MIIPIKQGYKSLQQNRVDALDNVLSYLFLSEASEHDWDWIEPYYEPGVAKLFSKHNRLPLSYFDGADVSWLYESLTETTSYDRIYFPWFEADMHRELRELPGPWDSCSAAYFAEVAEGKVFRDEFRERAIGKDATYLFTLLRYRTVPLKEVRGLFRLRSSLVIEEATAHLFSNGKYTSNREMLQYFSGAWHCVGVPFEIIPPSKLDDVGQDGVYAARSKALTAEYDWSVHIGFNVKSVPTVSLPSDPISARDVFRLRDVPPGKTRREALKHWVRGHTRKGIPPDYVERHIWPYLRGAEEFTWNGLYCKIQPSAYDLRKAREYQLMRKKQHAAVC